MLRRREPLDLRENRRVRELDRRTLRRDWCQHRGTRSFGLWYRIDFLKGCLQRIEEQRRLQALTGNPRSTGKSKRKSMRTEA